MSADEPAICKRCGEQITVECGYELSEHGFCWPCCDEIVAKLLVLVTSRDFTGHAEQLLITRNEAIRPTVRRILHELINQATAPRA